MALANASNNATDPGALVRSVPKERVTGLMRDLRGICAATNNRKNYGEETLLASRMPHDRTHSMYPSIPGPEAITKPSLSLKAARQSITINCKVLLKLAI